MRALVRIIRRPQFRLSTLFWLITAIAIFLGTQVARVCDQRKTIANVESVGGRAYYDEFYDHAPRGLLADWVDRTLGPDYLHEVTGVLFECESRVSDELVEQLCIFKRLKFIDLSGTTITKSSATYLAKLTELEVVNLARTAIDDSGVCEICRLPKLRVLDLDETACSDACMPSVGNMRRLEKLTISGIGITDRGIEHLRRMHSLRDLWLHHTSVSDAAIPILEQMGQLTNLTLSDSKLSERGCEELERRLPHALTPECVRPGMGPGF